MSGNYFVRTSAVIDLSNSAALAHSDSPFIGSSDGTQMLKGRIDDLRLYDRVLTQFEVVTLAGILADSFESGNTTAWSSSTE